MSRYQSGDPYWMNLKFEAQDAKSGLPLKKGTRVFYFPRNPRGRQFYSGEAGEQAARDFQAAASDEAFANGESW